MNDAPFSRSSSASVPSCARATQCAIASPSPLPPALPLTKRSNKRSRNSGTTPSPSSLTRKAGAAGVDAGRHCDARCRMTYRVFEQIAEQFLQAPRVAVDDRGLQLYDELDVTLARGVPRVSRTHRCAIAAKSTGSRWSSAGLGERASVSRSPTMALASSAVLAIVSNVSCNCFGSCVPARRLRDGGDGRQRRTQFVRSIGNKRAFALLGRKQGAQRQLRETPTRQSQPGRAAARRPRGSQARPCACPARRRLRPPASKAPEEVSCDIESPARSRARRMRPQGLP